MNIYDKPFAKKHIDWKQAIQTKDDSKTVDVVEWDLCAVGQLTKSIVRLRSKAPLDVTLAEHGADFATAYLTQDWDSAVKFLKKIEERAKELIDG